MAFTAYATVPQFKAEWVSPPLSDTVDDIIIGDILDSVSRWIDDHCDRHFWRDGATGSEVARTFAACNPWSVEIDDLVPGTITTLKTDGSGDGTFETTWSASDYQLLPVNRPAGEPFDEIEAVGGQLFPVRYGRGTRANRIEVTGIWGWTAVPKPVHLACLIQAKRDLQTRNSPEGILGLAELGGVRVPGQIDPRAIDKLEPYRRTAVLVA